MIFGTGTAKATSYGAGIIHFLGGIIDLLLRMRPLLFVAVILGGMTGVATYSLLDFGFKSPASPGSFIVYMLNAPKGIFTHGNRCTTCSNCFIYRCRYYFKIHKRA